MPREFDISPKSTAEWLSSQNFSLRDVDNLKIVTDDIVLNAAELTRGEINWDYALKKVVCNGGWKQPVGREAVAKLAAPGIGTIGSKLKRAMDDPYMVYLSADFFRDYYAAKNKVWSDILKDTLSEYADQAIPDREYLRILCAVRGENKSQNRQMMIDWLATDQIDKVRASLQREGRIPV